MKGKGMLATPQPGKNFVQLRLNIAQESQEHGNPTETKKVQTTSGGVKLCQQ